MKKELKIYVMEYERDPWTFHAATVHLFQRTTWRITIEHKI